MLSHKPQIPGNALLHWAEQRCCEGACSLLAPSPSGCCQHRLANPQKALNIFRHSLSPCRKQDPTHPDSSPLPPNTRHYFFPRKVVCSLTYCWWGQRVQSKGTKVSPGRTGQGCCWRWSLSSDHRRWAGSIVSTGFIGYHSAALRTEFSAT